LIRNAVCWGLVQPISPSLDIIGGVSRFSGRKLKKGFLYPKGISLGFNGWRDRGKEGRFGFGGFYLIGFKGVLRFVIHFYLI